MPRLTRQEFEQKRREIQTLIHTESAAFDDYSQSSRKKRLEKAKDDLMYFAETYLPHYFYDGFARFHRDMIRATDRREKPVLVVSAGGFGKSTIITLLRALHSICYQTHHFVVLASMTEDVASQPTTLLKLELEENERLRADFGNLVGTGSWEEGDFVTANDVRVKARGVGQAFRGLRWRQYRPSLVILDDIEDNDIAVSPRRTQKTLNWIVATVLPRMDVKGWQLIVVGNIINRTGVVGSLLYHPDYAYWLRRVYPAQDGRGNPLWPDRFPLPVLRKLQKIMGYVRYAGEMLCAPIDDTHYFRPEMTAFGKVEHIDNISDVVAYIDPSVLASTAGDYKAIVAIGKLSNDHREHICSVFIKHSTVREMVNACYKIYDKIKPKVFVLEGNGYQQHLKRDFDEAAKRQGFSLPLALQNNLENKDIRIERIVSYHDAGDIVFYNDLGDTKLLLEQLYQWEPRGREHDDGPDALAGALDYRSGRAKKARFRRI